MSYFWRDPILLLAIATGAGWALSICLLWINAWQRQRIAALETDVAEARQQSSAFAASAKSVSDASLSAINVVVGAVANAEPPPRRQKKSKE